MAASVRLLRRRGVPLLIAAAVAGCASRPEPDAPRPLASEGAAPADAPASAPAARAALIARERTLATRFAAGASILSGFDRPDGDASWRIGDQVLFGLSLEDGVDVFTRFVALELRSDVVPEGGTAVGVARYGDDPAPRPFSFAPRRDPVEFYVVGEKRELPPGPWVAVAVGVYDAEGKRLETELIALPETALRRGFHAAAELAAEGRRETQRRATAGPLDEAATAKLIADDGDRLREPLAVIVGAVYGFLEIFRSSPALEALRAHAVSEVVDKPGVLSIVLGGGVTGAVGVDANGIMATSRRIPAVVSDVAALRLPFELELNDRPAMNSVLYVASTAPPLHLAAGVVGLEAHHPSRRERRLELRLLAARRGAAAPASR